METGFIKLYRKMVDWQWYKNNNAFRLFLHLLLTVNYKDKKWENTTIKRGERVFSIKGISEEIPLTPQQIRTSLNKLQSSQDITIKTTNRYTLVSIVKYSDYQDITAEINKEIDKQITNNQQTNNKQLTTTKEYKERKNIIINNNKYFEYEELNKIFLEYLELRKKIKVVNTERAINTLLKTLNSYADDIKIKMIENAIVNSWKSIYPIEDKKQSKTQDKKTYKNYEQREYKDLESYYDN